MTMDGSAPIPQMPPQGPTPAGQPTPGAGGMGQPPIGSSPATQPVANKGLEAAGVARLGVAVHVLEQAVPMIGSSSEIGRDVMKALNLLGKHVPPGSQSQGVNLSAIQELLSKARQMGPQIAAMRGAPSGAAPQPGMGAQAPQPPVTPPTA